MNNVKNFVKSLIFFTIFFIGIVSAASVWTNKNSYNFGETVIIYGGGFLPTQDVSIEVDNPNDVFLFSNQTSPDNNGNFTSFYIISDQDPVNMIEGTYKIYANSQSTSSQNTFSVSSSSLTTSTTSTTSTITTAPTTTPPSNGGGGNPLKTTTTTTSTTTTTTLPPGLTLLILNESNNGNLADTFVDQGSNKTNYGKWNFTQVSSGSGMPFSNYRTFMLWDTKAIPPGSSIINAKISLYQNMPSAYNKMTLDLYNTSSMNSTGWTWSEYNLTWSNMPSLGTLQSSMNSTNAIGWKSWNVTDAFIAAYSNGNNFSLEIKNRTESTTNDVVSFVTKENATHPNLRPQLEIYYYLPITTTTTTSTTTISITTTPTTTTSSTTSTTTRTTTTSTTTTITSDTEKPRWSNLYRNPPEPIIITVLDSITINVTWYDNQDLNKVIIWENSTGGWQGHVVYP